MPAATATAGPDLSRFEKLGIRSEHDLLLHLPLRYEDETRLTPIAQARGGAIVQVQGAVVRAEVSARGRRSLLVTVDDGTGSLSMRFFHFYPSQLKQLVPGQLIRAIGELRTGLFGAELIHPRYHIAHEDMPLPTRLTPVYPAAAGIGQQGLRGAVLGSRAIRQVRESKKCLVSIPSLSRMAVRLKRLFHSRSSSSRSLNAAICSRLSCSPRSWRAFWVKLSTCRIIT